MKKLSFAIIGFLLVLAISTAFGAVTQKPEFVLDSFKMKLGSTLPISGIMKGEVDLNGFESSDTTVVEILAGGTLKARSTGRSILSYTYLDARDREITLECHIEVNRYEGTFDVVSGSVKKEIIYHTLDLGDYQVIVEDTRGAKPSFPEVKREGYIFGGWYLDPGYEVKLGESQRFGVDTTFYARWITVADEGVSASHSAFYDDIEGHWAKNAIEAISYKGYFNGVAERTFGPELTMTRAMAVAVLGRMEEVSTSGDYDLKVSDVSTDAYYAPYLGWAISNNIVTDVKDGAFRPNDNITREEIANYIANYVAYKKYDVELIYAPTFNDIGNLSSTSKDAIKLLFNATVMNGMTENTFGPAELVTRAQMAQIFYNLYNFSMKSEL